MTRKKVVHRNKNVESWIHNTWRPAMAWMYLVVCVTDFIIFPVLWSIFNAKINSAIPPWEPLTLKGAGLFHLAMGAVLGISSWGRSQERVNSMPMSTYQPIQNQDNIYHQPSAQPKIISQVAKKVPQGEDQEL